MSSLIQYQFGQFGPYNESIYGYYDAQMLNESANVINASIASGSAVAPGYLFATLRAYNATAGGDDGTNGNGDGGSNPSSGKSTTTSLAMCVFTVPRRTRIHIIRMPTGSFCMQSQDAFPPSSALS
jgi:hypothetical protein